MWNGTGMWNGTKYRKNAVIAIAQEKGRLACPIPLSALHAVNSRRHVRKPITVQCSHFYGNFLKLRNFSPSKEFSF